MISAIRQREIVVRFSYITFAQIWNFQTVSEARGHENTIRLFRKMVK